MNQPQKSDEQPNRDILARKIITEFISELRKVQSESENRVQVMNHLREDYRQKLASIGATPEEIEGHSSFQFICFELDKHVAKPINNPTLATVLTSQIAVEAMLRKYLRTQYPLFPWEYLAKEKRWSYFEYLDLWKECSKNNPFDLTLIRRGMREVGQIRNQYAHTPTYELTDKDFKNIKKFFESYAKQYCQVYPFDNLLTYYVEFCELACAHLHGAFWEYSQKWEWKIEPCPEKEMTWESFINRHSTDHESDELPESDNSD